MTAPSPLHERRRLGALTVHLIQAGGQKLDGGAMFGIVPRPLWERRIAPDVRHRIPLGMRCLLIEHPEGLVLVDTGAGSKESQKFHDIYGIENAGSPTQLEDGIRAAGHEPEDVRLVIDTHLHFDHAGGNTRLDDGGGVVPSFPNATYVVQRGELEYASRANERTAASYFPHNYAPLATGGRLRLVDGETELLPGLRVVPTPGHTPHHQSVLLTSDDETLFYPADLIPTMHHVPLPWIMGYDVEPLVTLETKRTMLGRAADESWVVVFEHDAAVGWSHIVRDDKGYAAAP